MVSKMTFLSDLTDYLERIMVVAEVYPLTIKLT